MICAADSLPEGATEGIQVAIVGAGPVGLAVAQRIAGHLGRIVIFEAGGKDFEPSQTSEFFRAARISDPRHLPTELNRRRMLGGTSSIWGGRCIPFDQEDFASTKMRPGWPIPLSEVEPYFPEALKFLDAGDPYFSASSALPDHRIPIKLASSDIVIDRIERYSKPTNLWRKSRAALANRRDVLVIHGATCTSLVTNAEGTRAIGLKLRTESNRVLEVRTPVIVLACGGLETPRLLLASRETRKCGLGNERDLVGRFYMTHLVSDARNVGSLRFAVPEIARIFDYNRTLDGVYARRMILLSPEVKDRHGIGNIVFRPNRPPIDDVSHRDPVLSAMFLAKGLVVPKEYIRSLIARSGTSETNSLRAHLLNTAKGMPTLCKFGVDWLKRRVLATRKLPSVFLYRRDGVYPIEFNAEQMPNRESRVLLGSEPDPFGVPRLTVQWQMRDSELAWICEAYRALAAGIDNSGLGHVKLPPDLPARVAEALVPQGGHHIGTVRMGGGPETGVVDPAGQLWGTKGVFVAGAAILPTSGFANPTLTAVALAFRLANYLIRQGAAGDVAGENSRS
jgi:choline dehydrogenase-like flavoprotein